MNYDESAEVIVIDSNSIVYTRVLQVFFSYPWVIHLLYNSCYFCVKVKGSVALSTLKTIPSR